MSWLTRVLLAVASLALLIPATGKGVLFTWITDVVGIMLAGAVLAFELWNSVRLRRGVAGALAPARPFPDAEAPRRNNPDKN
jgi:hypothetical protein